MVSLSGWMGGPILSFVDAFGFAVRVREQSIIRGIDICTKALSEEEIPPYAQSSSNVKPGQVWTGLKILYS